MSSADSAATLVARFLKTNNYHETLEAFLREAGLPNDTGLPSSDALTIEQVLREKKAFDVSQTFEKVSIDDSRDGWSLPAPSTAHNVDSIPNASNVLHVSVESFDRPGQDNHMIMIVSSANKSISTLSTSSSYSTISTNLSSHDSPILSWVVLLNRFILTTTMSGSVYLNDIRSISSLRSRRDHQKYVVAVARSEDQEGVWLATAAWDGQIFLYRLQNKAPNQSPPQPDGILELGEPVASISLPTNPESIVFINHPELELPVLLLTRRDSTFLYYYTLPNSLCQNAQDPSSRDSSSKSNQLPSLPLLGRQNLAPHSNAWIAFTPSALALSPTDPSLIAVATSHTPHMKLIIARLLLPPPLSTSEDGTALPPEPSVTSPTVLDATTGPIINPTQASEARRLLAIQDREAAAIQIQVSTMAPQTAYSTPALAWRPDGSGLWVNGDDGVVRGIEVSSGKIVKALKDGHEPGSKVRCLWAGCVDRGEGKEELVVSGGFDRRLVVWRCNEGGP